MKEAFKIVAKEPVFMATGLPTETLETLIQDYYETHDHLKGLDRKSTRLNSSHGYISYAVFCLKKKKNNKNNNNNNKNQQQQQQHQQIYADLHSRNQSNITSPLQTNTYGYRRTTALTY